MKFFTMMATMLFSLAALASAPNYAQKPNLAVGEYGAIEDYGCKDGVMVCESARVYLEAGKPMIELGDRKMPLMKTASGVLVFKASFSDDCDSNGCADVDTVSGLVYPKKEGAKYVPVIKTNITLICGWGDDEACPHNESLDYVVRMRRL